MFNSMPNRKKGAPDEQPISLYELDCLEYNRITFHVINVQAIALGSLNYEAAPGLDLGCQGLVLRFSLECFDIVLIRRFRLDEWLTVVF